MTCESKLLSSDITSRKEMLVKIEEETLQAEEVNLTFTCLVFNQNHTIFVANYSAMFATLLVGRLINIPLFVSFLGRSEPRQRLLTGSCEASWQISVFPKCCNTSQLRPPIASSSRVSEPGSEKLRYLR